MIQFEYIKEAHIDEIVAIEEANFSMPWSRKSFEEALTDALAMYVVALIENKVVGYAGLWKALDEANITNVAVKAEFRKQGIGTAMVKHLLEGAKEEGIAKVFLEVRQSNLAAQSVYGQCGFRKIGLRKNFYEKPMEDAIVMMTDI
ncbi:MAG: ribosomal protein S18-alanine N-acetyltransferase [Lachnospiraceae bacterium]|nr:ribosomal protein S18-alanine N-acetyltransferase [Lachnospiraceae bacterium]